MVGHPVIGIAGCLAVNRGGQPAARDNVRECHFVPRKLCGICAELGRVLIFLSKHGCPAWIRTMTKSSKDSCATITPPDKPSHTSFLPLCAQSKSGPRRPVTPRH